MVLPPGPLLAWKMTLGSGSFSIDLVDAFIQREVCLRRQGQPVPGAVGIKGLDLGSTSETTVSTWGEPGS